MSTTPELPVMVSREMIEAHYKSVMNAARILLSQGETIHAQDLLSDACRLPYPIPAPATLPEKVDVWSTEYGQMLVDYFNICALGMQEPTTADTARLIDAALDNLNAKARGGTP